MKRLFAVGAALLGLTATPAASQVVYYVTGAPYTAVANSTACPVGDCSATYTTQQRLSGTVTFFGPLDPDLDVQTSDVGPMIEDFNLSDGQNTYRLMAPDGMSFTPNIVINAAAVSTNAGREITAFEFKIDRTNGSPFSVSAAASPDVKTRVASIYFSSVHPLVLVQNNARCTLRGASSTGTPSANLRGCQNTVPVASEGAANATSSAVTMSLTPPPTPVPTLSEWAMLLLGGLLAGGAALTIHRRRTTAA